ncbi:MAG: hypothetical protein A2216_00125 [Omnitrophica WOR_2 bacterium RIFOXYA2_FULL_45_12]|nr:MAG: hypothetical protein A2216_00125 [Omnitrophica WOR_2 bacterium RIFOXYA2_FULL_45_12]HBU08194.1 hypothetical protein [Candidatus Omnitrophota bacterium]
MIFFMIYVGNWLLGIINQAGQASKPSFKFFPEFVAIGKNLITKIFNKIAEIYHPRFNLCNLRLITVIRSFPDKFSIAREISS